MADNPVRRLPDPGDGLGRVETGPVQIGDDWPGLFIRGDCAFGLAMSIKAVLTHFEDNPKQEIGFALHDLQSLYKDILTQVIIGGNEMYNRMEDKLPPEG